MGTTAILKLSATPVTMIQAEGPVTVKTLALANLGAVKDEVSVSLVRGGVPFGILEDFVVPGRKTISVFLSKDLALYLEDGDSLEVSSSKENTVNAVVAYENS
jgi:hypothetical protein